MLGAPDTMVGSGQWDPCRIPRGTWPEQTPITACMVLWGNSSESDGITIAGIEPAGEVRFDKQPSKPWLERTERS